MTMFDWLHPETADLNLSTTISQTISDPLQQSSSAAPDTTVQAMRDVMPIVNSLPKPGEPETLTPIGNPTLPDTETVNNPAPELHGGGIPYDANTLTQLQDAYTAPPPGAVPGRPKPIGVKGAMKNALLSMIPIVGPALVGPGIAKRNQEKADWQIKQNQANEQWKNQQSMIGDMLKDQYKQTMRTQNINRYMNYFLSPMGGALSQTDALRNATALAEGHEIPALQGMKSVQLVTKMGESIIGLKDASGHYFRGSPVGGGVIPLNLSDIAQEYDIGVKPQHAGGSELKSGTINGKPAYARFNPYEGTLTDLQGNDVSQIFVPNESGGTGLDKQQYELEKRIAAAGNNANPEDIRNLAAIKRTRMTVPAGTFGLNEPGRQEDRVTRSYQYHTTQLEKVRKPLEDALDRFSRLEETIAQGTPQADALVAPELLTVMAGGQGSGLRMNEAEISRIVGGRSKWQSLQAKINQWQKEPEKARSITPEQSSQIRALMAAVRKKSDAKQFILSKAQDELMASNDVDAHRKIYSQAKNDIFAVGQGSLRIVNGQIFERQKDGTWLPRENKKAKP